MCQNTKHTLRIIQLLVQTHAAANNQNTVPDPLLSEDRCPGNKANTEHIPGGGGTGDGGISGDIRGVSVKWSNKKSVTIKAYQTVADSKWALLSST